MKQIIIFGTGQTSEAVSHYFEKIGNINIAAYCLDGDYITSDKFMKRPVISLEDISKEFDNEYYDIFVAIAYSKLNKIREEKLLNLQKLGYKAINFIHPDSYIVNANLKGENILILEKNVIQPNVSIGNNTYVWSGNHIGHHTQIGSNCYVSSHVVISGSTTIGDNSFIGVNATIRDNISIGNNNIIGARSLIMKDTDDYSVFQEKGTEKSKVKSFRISI